MARSTRCSTSWEEAFVLGGAYSLILLYTALAVVLRSERTPPCALPGVDATAALVILSSQRNQVRLPRLLIERAKRQDHARAIRTTGRRLAHVALMELGQR